MFGLEIGILGYILIFLATWVVSGGLSSFVFTRNTAKLKGEVSPNDREDAIYVFVGGYISFIYYLFKYLLVRPFNFVLNYGEYKGLKAHEAYKKELAMKNFAMLPEAEREKEVDKALKELDKEFRRALKMGR